LVAAPPRHVFALNLFPRLHSRGFYANGQHDHFNQPSNQIIHHEKHACFYCVRRSHCSLAITARAGFLDQLKSAVTTTNSAVTAASALSQDQMAGGLKEALGKGVEHAVSSLGHDGGFLTNLDVKIPKPGKLQTMEKTLRLAGQNQLADDFVGSMNHAAEKTVPVAAPVFGDAVFPPDDANKRRVFESMTSVAV
jgi:hypothetical protein